MTWPGEVVEELGGDSLGLNALVLLASSFLGDTAFTGELNRVLCCHFRLTGELFSAELYDPSEFNLLVSS